MVPLVIKMRQPEQTSTVDEPPDSRLEVPATILADPLGTMTSDVSLSPVTFIFDFISSPPVGSSASQPSIWPSLIPTRPVVPCTLPSVNLSTQDMLVATLSSLSNSYEDRNVQYFLRNKTILSKNSQSLGKGLGMFGKT